MENGKSKKGKWYRGYVRKTRGRKAIHLRLEVRIEVIEGYGDHERRL